MFVVYYCYHHILTIRKTKMIDGSTDVMGLQSSPSGVATPGHTQACAHVGAWVKTMYKAKVNNQLLACAIASFMQT